MITSSFHFNGADQSRSDRLLRASVSAYCSLTRPGRQDAIQLQDLALPLLDGASRDTLRYSSAALSICETEPHDLVLRLADMSIDIAAPVLARATSLTDVELIDLIGRHGVQHSRVVASRANLHPSIRHLTEIVEAQVWSPEGAEEDEEEEADSELVEDTRDRLRAIMQAAQEEFTDDKTEADFIYADLRRSALSGNADQLAACLAASLGVLVPIARTILRDASCALLIPALRAIGLADERAFLIASAAFPLRFPSADSMRTFLKIYNAMPFEEIEVYLTRWQETGSAAVRLRQSG